MSTIAKTKTTLMVAALTVGGLAGYGCDTPTVQCVEDVAAPGGVACLCKRGTTPPSCVDLGSCLDVCPGAPTHNE